MKTFMKILLGKVLSWLASSSTEELMAVVNLVVSTAKQFPNKKGEEKFELVLSVLKEMYSDKEESILRYLIETAVRFAKKTNQI